MTFDEACDVLEPALAGDLRPRIVADCLMTPSYRHALTRLRDGLRAHVLKLPAARLDLSGLVASFDARTRQDGFNVLHDWDGKAARLNDDTIVVDVLNHLIKERGGEPVNTTSLAILLDYYFFYLLALLSLRAWDDGRAEDHFDRLSALVGLLQGPTGSGQRFVDDGETLLIIATSHYEPKEHGYDLLLERVRTLDHPHQVHVALGHAATMGCHLRFGFEATYGRSMALMREDNVADYPWLCYGVATCMKEYARMVDAGEHGPARDRIVEAVMGGLSPDAAAFVNEPSGTTTAHDVDRLAFLERFERLKSTFLDEAEAHRPSSESYSPFSLFYNFSQNVLKGTVADALLWGEVWTVSMNDLFTAVPKGDPRAKAKETLARTLMGYARAAPDTIRGKLMPAIVYDPRAGRQMFQAAFKHLRGR